MLERFAALPQIVAVIERSERRALGVTVEGVPVELRRAAAAAFGTELLRATGSAAYVGALEPLPEAPDEARRLSRARRALVPAGAARGPFRGAPPALLETADIRGDLHCHTTWSDGRLSVEEMARAARERGYDYIAICDHTPAVGAVRGLTADDVRRQGEEIAAANALLAPFRVLRGIECDILPDGRLDLPDAVLAELDWVQASVHGGQRMPRAEMTRRVAEALANPHVRCLSHPTGRLIGRRPENALDLERAFALALEHGVAVEVNGLPARLDLSGEHVRGGAAGRRAHRLLDRRALGRRARQHAALRPHRPPRRRHRGRRAEHAARGGAPGSGAVERLDRLREHLGVAVDVGLRGRRRHQRHVVERRDEHAAVEHEEMQHVLELGVVQRGARAAGARRLGREGELGARAELDDRPRDARAPRARRARRRRSGRRARSSRAKALVGQDLLERRAGGGERERVAGERAADAADVDEVGVLERLDARADGGARRRRRRSGCRRRSPCRSSRGRGAGPRRRCSRRARR